MKAREELVHRLALKRRRKLGSMSDEAFNELELAVRQDPYNFIDDDEEQAFALVARALETYYDARRDDGLLDDTEFAAQRMERNDALSDACRQALALDRTCIDARLLTTLVIDGSQDLRFEMLYDDYAEFVQKKGSITIPATGDAWSDVFMRPRLRLQAALARTCINTSRFRLATEYCVDMLTKAPLDALGARLTCALAMARLEDEEGFNWLDAREGRRGNAWFHLSRVLLMYKLGRAPAARRALRGFDQFCVGGAYLLLQPLFVDTYLPDRPPYEPNTFEESMLCLHEADPIITDAPDFAAWARKQTGFLDSAHDFCIRNGFEWRDW